MGVVLDFEERLGGQVGETEGIVVEGGGTGGHGWGWGREGGELDLG